MKKKITCSILVVISIVLGTDLNSKIHISKPALELIGNAEGCRLNPYKCPAGIVTNGIGNTTNVPNTVISYQKVAADWVSNIEKSEQCLLSVTKNITLSQGQFDAFTSFIFNVGCKKFKSSTMFKYLKRNEIKKACNELPKWIYSKHKVLPGLVKRRQKELNLCLQ